MFKYHKIGIDWKQFVGVFFWPTYAHTPIYFESLQLFFAILLFCLKRMVVFAIKWNSIRQNWLQFVSKHSIDEGRKKIKRNEYELINKQTASRRIHIWYQKQPIFYVHNNIQCFVRKINGVFFFLYSSFFFFLLIKCFPSTWHLELLILHGWLVG